ncbi:MAG: hypothetical protein R3D51_13725 [Hyphomicrobiaceae bacterium]
MVADVHRGAFIKPYHAVMSMVFAVALGAGWMMLPGDSELIAMLERDGHSRDALAILEQGYANGDRRYRTLHQMLGLYEYQGDATKARTILEEMVSERPYDPALRERLVNFYQAVGDGKARLDALKAQIETRYKESACREYVALLRLDGHNDDELAGLQFCRQRGYRRPDDLARLAVLLAATGDTVQASATLRSIDDVKRLTTTEERFLLVDLLLRQGLPNEAVRRAVRWIKAGKDTALAVGLVDVLARSKFPDSALDLAKNAGEAGDSVSLTVAERLLEKSQQQAAILYLRGWLDAAQMEDLDVARRFIGTALDGGDPRTALRGARKFGLANLDPKLAETLARGLEKVAMRQEAEEVRETAHVHLAQPQQPREPTSSDAGSAQTKSDSRASGQSGSEARVEAAHAAPRDMLAVWRRSLSSHMSDDAQKLSAKLGFPMPRPSPPRHHGATRTQAQSTTKVLKKTDKVLQRAKKLNSLKLKQKAVRERAQSAKGKVRPPAQ